LIVDKANGCENFSTEERWLLEYSRPIQIKFVGVWDTVGKLDAKSIEFLNTGVRSANDYCFHALAIDEHRADFAPTLWTKDIENGVPESPPRRHYSSVEQRWFAGAHANVGGGCDSDFLPQAALKWLKEKAQLHGLAFREEIDLNKSDLHSAAISDSYSEFWRGFYRFVRRRHYREIGADPEPLEGNRSRYSINETIDISVFDRCRAVPSYRPCNLLDWAKRHGVKLEEITHSVRADDPAVRA
jgi:hypothetical protein